jgi:hypothetical protein
MKPTVAPHTTYGTLDSNVTVQNGDTIRVFAVSCYNGSGAPVKVQLQFADGSGVYADIGVKVGETELWDNKFLADRGLRVASVGSSAATVSVFHSGGGS